MTSRIVSLFLTISLIILIGCGGGNAPGLPTQASPETTISAASVLSMSMIGQTWTFQNGYGDINHFVIEAAPPIAACRGGNNLVIHMTKTVDRTYWGLTIPQAEILFLLHQNPDGSWRSTASLMSLPQGCPWCGPNGQPSTDPLFITSDVVDTKLGMPPPYMIAPPNTNNTDHFIFETRVGATADNGLTYACNIPAMNPLVGPTDGEYWRTDFYQKIVSTPIYSGPAIVSDQFEGPCGHEKWYFAPGKGIVRIETLTDGGEIKNNPNCATAAGIQTHDPKLTINRIN